MQRICNTPEGLSALVNHAYTSASLFLFSHMKKSFFRSFGPLTMGAERKGAPLSIDFGQAMKDAVGEAYHLEITGKQTSSCHSDQGENDISSYTDDFLNNKIQSYQNHLKGSGLLWKDNGEKMRIKLAQFCREREKRQKSTTDNQENDQEKSKSSAFKKDLETLRGVPDDVNIKIEAFGKSSVICKLSEEASHGQKCISSSTVDVSSFYSSSRHPSIKHNKQYKNKKSPNEAEKSMVSGVASGKRNRATSPYGHEQKDKKSLFGRSPPVSNRKRAKFTSEKLTPTQKRRLFPGLPGCEDSRGASLDTAMELSDDEERRGHEDSKADIQHGKGFLARDGLRSNFARKNGFRITYPSGDPDAVEVQQADLTHLNAYEFLNDTVIDFYIKYLQRPEFLSKERKTVFHFFNSFFFKKLLLEKSKKRKAENYLSKMRKWTKGINIFEKKYLLVPIHNCAHWSLAIICFAMECHEKGILTPYVLHLDSMKEGHVSEDIFKVLKSYLEAEWDHVKGLDAITDGRTVALKNAFCKRVEAPLQQNAWDCGLFLLYYIERFLCSAENKFEPHLLDSMFGRHWFKPQEASNLRTRIKGLLQSLANSENTEIMMEDMD